MKKVVIVASATMIVVMLIASNTEAKVVKTIYSFKQPEALPAAGVIRDSNGTLYGTTIFGGVNDAGSVYSFDPKSNQYKTLHDFGNGDDGSGAAGILNFDNSGNIIGVTSAGGSANLGTIYRIDPATGAELVLYSFPGGKFGSRPAAFVVVDNAGAIYGTTATGGTSSYGSVFKFDPATSQMSIVYSFPGGKGSQDPGGITQPNSNGIVYGTTNEAPGVYEHRSGILYSLNISNGAVQILHEFRSGSADGTDPDFPYIDRSGRIIGTTLEGGSSNRGTVYTYDPASKAYAIVYNFPASQGPALPLGVGAVDRSGNIYGISFFGGGKDDHCHALYKLSATYKETTLYSFGNDTCTKDHQSPASVLTPDNKGDYYGTTERGLGSGFGTIFLFKP